jgi:hypothetical protein
MTEVENEWEEFGSEAYWKPTLHDVLEGVYLSRVTESAFREGQTQDVARVEDRDGMVWKVPITAGLRRFFDKHATPGDVIKLEYIGNRRGMSSKPSAPGARRGTVTGRPPVPGTTPWTTRRTPGRSRTWCRSKANPRGWSRTGHPHARPPGLEDEARGPERSRLPCCLVIATRVRIPRARHRLPHLTSAGSP